MKIVSLTASDFDRIRAELADYRGPSDALRSAERHRLARGLIERYPDFALAVKLGDLPLAYIIGAPAGTRRSPPGQRGTSIRDAKYGMVHLAAVRGSHRGRGLGREIYGGFARLCASRGLFEMRATADPRDAVGLGFHRALGFRLCGHVLDPETGVPVVRNYAGRGEARTVLIRDIARFNTGY